MSTECKITLSKRYPESQVRDEMRWIEREMKKVEEQMKRKPSKIRHLNDLKRQYKQKEEIIARGYRYSD